MDERTFAYLKLEVLKLAGLDSDDFVYPHTVEYLAVVFLKNHGTACGETGNTCFNLKAIGWLNAHGVDLAIVCRSTQTNWTVSSMAIILPMSLSGNFSRLVNRYGGSLRPERLIYGWTGFESE